MRSVVVVLPASMCAMIPMFRVFSSGNVRGIVRKVSLELFVANRGHGAAQEETSGLRRDAPIKKARTGLGASADSARVRLYRAALHGLMSARMQHRADARATAEYSRCMMPFRQAE